MVKAREGHISNLTISTNSYSPLNLRRTYKIWCLYEYFIFIIILYYKSRVYKIEIIYNNKGKNVYKMKKSLHELSVTLREHDMFSSLSFLTLIILDTETAAYFLTVSFMTLENGIFNPPKRILHFDSSLRLTEKILKVPASWGQQISTLELHSKTL